MARFASHGIIINEALGLGFGRLLERRAIILL